METTDTPSVLALSRQGLPQLRLNGYEKSGVHQDEHHGKKSARGGYVLKEGSATPEVTLVATGSEVGLADEARTMLEVEGIATRLVSVPCLDLLLVQDADYKTELLGPSAAVVVVEAGLEMHGRASFVGMKGFGASRQLANCMPILKLQKRR